MRIPTLAAILAATFVLAPAAFAAPSGGKAACGPHHRACTQQQVQHRGHAPRRDLRGPAKWAHAHPAPRIGDSARNGRRFQRAAHSRFRAPARGQEYRVVNDHLVLVDQRSLRIVAVLGLLTALAN